jgi:hypothetical protein
MRLGESARGSEPSTTGSGSKNSPLAVKGGIWRLTPLLVARRRMGTNLRT